MATSETKISVYSLTDLKNTSDDALPNYLNSLKFKQSHTLTDVRLAIGYSMLLICGACFYWDYKLGFESTKLYTAIAVALYTILNGTLSLWIWFVEKGQVYIGTSPAGDKISIASSTTKNVPIYKLAITYKPAKGGGKPISINLDRPFAEWFDATGHFVSLPFQQMLARAVPVIGAADPSRAAPAPSTAAAKEAEPKRISDEAILEALESMDTTSTTGSDAKMRAKKSSKSRKKA